ncbi:helix-turn-helix domain-containing protein [Streptosporangium sp. NPDC000095]|uniref:helix-turn-helix domain-containing protein n=1 Tax=Streptosporangium sp. NPDC000095 TaxID=3366184 RepID=UPI0036BA11C6
MSGPRWARRAKSSQVLAMRSKIVLACANGLDNIEIAAALRIHRDTVSKWGGATQASQGRAASPDLRANRPASLDLRGSASGAP